MFYFNIIISEIHNFTKLASTMKQYVLKNVYMITVYTVAMETGLCKQLWFIFHENTTNVYVVFSPRLTKSQHKHYYES